MAALNKMSRTDVSAAISVLLFGMTILISAVGPAQAEGQIQISEETVPPTVGYTKTGYRA